MATIYNININTVSPWCSYTEEQVKELISEALNNLSETLDKNKFECTEITVERK